MYVVHPLEHRQPRSTAVNYINGWQRMVVILGTHFNGSRYRKLATHSSNLDS